MKSPLSICAISLALLSGVSFAQPPECKEPHAPRGCFEKLKYRLVPIEECDMAPTFDPDTGRITYPCGLRITPTTPRCEDQKVTTGAISARSTKKPGLPSAQVRYIGSTIRDNGDGTSTIDHGGSATETINTADAGKTVKEYGEKGIKISPK